MIAPKLYLKPYKNLKHPLAVDSLLASADYIFIALQDSNNKTQAYPLVTASSIVKVQKGDLVKKNQILAQLKDDAMEHQFDDASLKKMLDELSNPQITTDTIKAPIEGLVLDIVKAKFHQDSHEKTYIKLLPQQAFDTCRLTTSTENIFAKLEKLQNLDKLDLLTKIKDADIIGMGGAGFPSYVKFKYLKKPDYLFINAAECEPYINSDNALIQNNAEDILIVCLSIAFIYNFKQAFIALEKSKIYAIKMLQAAHEVLSCEIKNSNNPSLIKAFNTIKIHQLSDLYPAGSQQTLIAATLGYDLGKLPNNALCFNAATSLAIAKVLLEDSFSYSRLVSISFEAHESNIVCEVPFGTPISQVLERYCDAGTYQKIKTRQMEVVIGGPMMGYPLDNLESPILATTNNLLIRSCVKNYETNCINCSFCVEVCPHDLLPQELYKHIKTDQLDKTLNLNLDACIECRACDFVCPSKIPLVSYFKQAKIAIKLENQVQAIAHKSKIRTEFKMQRLEEEKILKQKLREEKRKQIQAKILNTDTNKID